MSDLFTVLFWLAILGHVVVLLQCYRSRERDVHQDDGKWIARVAYAVIVVFLCLGLMGVIVVGWLASGWLARRAWGLLGP